MSFIIYCQTPGEYWNDSIQNNYISQKISKFTNLKLIKLLHRVFFFKTLHVYCATVDFSKIKINLVNRGLKTKKELGINLKSSWFERIEFFYTGIR